MMMRLFSCLAVLLFLANGCSPPGVQSKSYHQLKEAWDDRNAPERLGVRSIQYDLLNQADFQSGELEQQPWSDSYWPYYKMGHAWRWMNPGETPPFKFETETSGPDPSDQDAYRQNWQDYWQNVQDDIGEAMSSVESWAARDWSEAVYVSPAEKYDAATGDDSFAFTRHELGDFARNRKYYPNHGITWSWMGYCHGWAAVSLLYDKPEHGVLIENASTGKEVLFTPGDIRGLISRAGSDNPISTRNRFMGTRCEQSANDFVTEPDGRPVDAALGLYDFAADAFSTVEPLQVKSTNWYGRSTSAPQRIQLDVTFSKDGESQLYRIEGHEAGWAGSRLDRQELVLSTRIFSGKRNSEGEFVKDQVIASATPEDIGRYVTETGDYLTDGGQYVVDMEKVRGHWARITGLSPEEVDPESYHHLKYFKSCRDVNAGSFHLAMTRYLSSGGVALNDGDKPHGFVIDFDTGKQVWNFPVFKFETKIGEPTPLTVILDDDSIQDPYRTWRAEDASQIVDVYTKVGFGVENGPLITYDQSDEEASVGIFRYTLELNEDGYVVGGEWHTHGVGGAAWDELTPLSGSELLVNLNGNDDRSRARMSSAPDFVWQYAPGGRIEGGTLVDADFINQLHACSVDPSAELESIVIDGATVQFSRCTYTE